MNIFLKVKCVLLNVQRQFYKQLEDVPRATPGISEVFDSVIAIKISRKFDKSMHNVNVQTGYF